MFLYTIHNIIRIVSPVPHINRFFVQTFHIPYTYFPFLGLIWTHFLYLSYSQLNHSARNNNKWRPPEQAGRMDGWKSIIIIIYWIWKEPVAISIISIKQNIINKKMMTLEIEMVSKQIQISLLIIAFFGFCWRDKKTLNWDRKL